jgi:hypothetical protein
MVRRRFGEPLRLAEPVQVRVLPSPPQSSDPLAARRGWQRLCRAVRYTAGLQGLGGSNPSPSATDHMGVAVPGGRQI